MPDPLPGADPSVDEDDALLTSEDGDTDDAGRQAKEDEELLAKVKPLLDQKLDEAKREWQSSKDKEAARLIKRVEDAEKRTTEAERQARRASFELRLTGLSGDAREVAAAKLEVEEAKEALKEERASLGQYARELVVKTLVASHAKYGLAEGDLEGCANPEEMEIVALRVENKALREGKVEPKTEERKTAPARKIDRPGGGAQGYDPKKYKGTGNVEDALKEKFPDAW